MSCLNLRRETNQTQHVLLCDVNWSDWKGCLTGFIESPDCRLAELSVYIYNQFAMGHLFNSSLNFVLLPCPKNHNKYQNKNLSVKLFTSLSLSLSLCPLSLSPFAVSTQNVCGEYICIYLNIYLVD